jgi:hypothetical protein
MDVRWLVVRVEVEIESTCLAWRHMLELGQRLHLEILDRLQLTITLLIVQHGPPSNQVLERTT